ncbi:hypothetical protein [Enterovibrio norvegicus]|uniref:hypothetical protein n=1 Tax=Enterovibrio norvegicus TaxID=188144 RepID=UPI0024B25803|nr:hypothetical protein [Enterovibrio norvegicus]
MRLRKRHDESLQEYRVSVKLSDLSAGKSIGCAHGNFGRIFVIPLLNGLPTTEATGAIICSVRLEGVEESIPEGQVMLNKTNPPTYEKPNWIGLADEVVVRADPASSPAGVDAIKLVIERW